MTTNHTPGPLNVTKYATPEYAPQYGIYSEGASGDIAHVMGPNARADAQLFAAAPEMLAALQALLCHPVGIDASRSKVAAARAAMNRALYG